MRCFCLWQKRCACGTMCAFGTFWIAGRVRLQSSVRFIKTHGLPRITKTTAVAVVFWCTRGESEGAKRRNSVTKMLASKVKRQPEGSTAEQWALKNARDSPENKTKQPQNRLFFGVPGGSRTLDTRRRRPVLYPTELRIRL